MTAPTENLVRAFIDPEAVHLRADNGDGSDGRTLYGHFAVFNRWTEIDSWYEGPFLERIAPGAFARTIDEHRDRVKVLYDHGFDQQLGNKPLGPIRELREDTTGVYYEVPLIETSYNDDFVLPAASAGLLGASFRFSVVDEERVKPKKATKYNPQLLEERTIKDVDLYEFGPVTFPAYTEATAGVRATTDNFIDRLLSDPAVLARFIDRSGSRAAAKFLEGLPSTTQARDNVQPPPAPDTLRKLVDAGYDPASVVAAVEHSKTDDSDHVETPPVPSFAERQQRARQIRLAQMRRA